MRPLILRRGFCAAAALWLLAAWPAAAHHGGDVEWADAPVGPISGTATKFAFQFPHVYFEMNVAEEGDAAPWTITTRWTPTILREHGWSRDSIKAGDKVTVTYLPHVEKPRVGQMVTVEVNGRPLPLSF
ncbi:MAG TPA: DUF6152 family protein [Gammaproteobacteria bacterium]|nr:DUF6152 family protein [Gammaproteobacteria bacterium]